MSKQDIPSHSFPSAAGVGQALPNIRLEHGVVHQNDQGVLSTTRGGEHIAPRWVVKHNFSDEMMSIVIRLDRWGEIIPSRRYLHRVRR